MKTRKFQGKIGELKRRTGEVQEIHVYANSSDFPDHELIILTEALPKFSTERVPINEELWQKIGVALEYRFRKPKKE